MCARPVLSHFWRFSRPILVARSISCECYRTGQSAVAGREKWARFGTFCPTFLGFARPLRSGRTLSQRHCCSTLFRRHTDKAGMTPQIQHGTDDCQVHGPRKRDRSKSRDNSLQKANPATDEQLTVSPAEE